MADHDAHAHAHKAQELLEAGDQWARGRLAADQLIASAQVEALLALAAAIERGREAAGVPPETETEI